MMMNDVLSNFSDPSQFSTDETMTPKPTTIVSKNFANNKRKTTANNNEQLLVPSPTTKKNDFEEESQSKKKNNSSSSSSIALLNSSNSNKLGSLIVRFVRARLQHMKLHTLQKLGIFVPDHELTAADELIFSVEEETSKLGEMIPTDIAAVDEAFQYILSDLSLRLHKEQQSSGKFAADTWYGALCHQVDDHAKLLVDFRNLQHENAKLERERNELKSMVMKNVADQEALVKKKLVEKQMMRMKTELNEGGTAKLTLELAMKDAEKRGGGGGNQNKNKNDAKTKKGDFIPGDLTDDSGNATSQNAEVAKSLRLQDELTVLRKSSHTLQLALSRVQHRYNLLLKEHEELKTEIRNVIAQQDAEEADIRRIFVEREREFDVATRKIHQLERELQSTTRKLDLAKSMRTFNQSQQQQQQNTSMNNNVPLSPSNNSSSTFQQQQPNSPTKTSLADRMQKLRGDTVGKMQVVFKNEDEDNNNAVQQDLLKTESTGVMNNQNNKNTEDGIIQQNNNNQEEDDVFENEVPEEFSNHRGSPKKNRPNQIVTMFSDDQEVEENDFDSYYNNNNPKRTRGNGNLSVDAFTMTEELQKKKQLTTIGTQTFFRISAASSLASLQQHRKNNSSSSGSGGASHNLTQNLLDEQIMKNQQQEKFIIDMEMKLDKMTRTMNKQCNVVEKFLDEQLSAGGGGSSHHHHSNTNVIFLKQDLLKMLKRFGIPPNQNATSSSTNSSSLWHQTLFRCPLFSSTSSPLLDPSSQDEEKLDHVLDEINKAMVEAKRLQMFSDQSCQTIPDSSFLHHNQTIISDTEIDQNDPLLAHLKKTSSMNNNQNSSPSNKNASSPTPKDVLQPPSSFWNATEAVNALKRVYVDAGRLMDSVETEAEVMMKFEREESEEVEMTMNTTHDNVNDISTGTTSTSEQNGGGGRRLNFSDIIQQQQDPSTETPTTSRPLSKHQQHYNQQIRDQQRQKQKQQNFEQIATEQFFAIRSLESSCKLLVQRLGYAKEDYVRRFYDRSNLLHQTLGNVSKTHPREANKLSRLAKTVQQARSVVPWITGIVSSGGTNQNNNNSQQQQETPPPPLQFKASEIVLGKPASSSNTTTTTTPPPPPSSSSSPFYVGNNKKLSKTASFLSSMMNNNNNNNNSNNSSNNTRPSSAAMNARRVL